jgi:hypothetical protein
MSAIVQHTDIADYYLGVLQNLNHDSKLDLISKLSQSLKTGMPADAITLQSLYGAYQSDETAEEIIAAIRASRTFNRNTETL